MWDFDEKSDSDVAIRNSKKKGLMKCGKRVKIWKTGQEKGLRYKDPHPDQFKLVKRSGVGASQCLASKGNEMWRKGKCSLETLSALMRCACRNQRTGPIVYRSI